MGFIGNATHATAHFFGRDAGPRHHAARADRLCRLDPARRRDVLRDLPRRADDRAGRLLRPGGLRTRSRSAGAFPISPRRECCLSGSTRPAAATSRGSIRRRSYAVLERYSPESIRGYRSEEELRYLVGTGVSAAAIFHLRAELDRAGFDKIKIVASSGFGPAKCRVMAEAKAPIDVVGSGSFLPSNWTRDLRHRRHRRVRRREAGQDRPRVPASRPAERRCGAAERCHPERSEGSASGSRSLGQGLTRCAQDDRRRRRCSSSISAGRLLDGVAYRPRGERRQVREPGAVLRQERAEDAGVSQDQPARPRAGAGDRRGHDRREHRDPRLRRRHVRAGADAQRSGAAGAGDLADGLVLQQRAPGLHPHQPAGALRHRHRGVRPSQGDRPQQLPRRRSRRSTASSPASSGSSATSSASSTAMRWCSTAGASASACRSRS